MKAKKSRIGFFLIFGFIAVCLPALALAQEKPLKLRVSYTSTDMAHAPIWMAQEAGLYRKHGLDAEVLFFLGTPLALQVLSAGEVGLTIAVTETVLRGNLKGSPFVMILGVVKKFPLFLITQPGITEINQLRGKKIASGRPGGLLHIAARYQLKQWGLEKDVVLLPAFPGGLEGTLVALKTKQFDGAVLPNPYNIVAKKIGLHEFFNFMKDGPDFLTVSATTTRPFLNKNEETIRRFVRAYVEATHLVKTYKERTLAAAPKYIRVTDREAFENAYGQIVPFVLSVPTIKEEDVRQVLSVMAETEPTAGQASPSAMYDMKYVRELEESGFIHSVLQAKTRQ